MLLGEFSAGKSAATPYLRRYGWGRMWVTRNPQFDYEGEPYGIDNGAFSAWRKSARWDDRPFLRRVDAALTSPWPPIIGILPDIVAGGARSLDFSLAWRERLPDAIPWYLAVQDGMAAPDLAPALGAISGVFLGGTDAFKRTVRVWRDWTRSAGLPLHYGRCGTARKLREAMDVGVDSVDSALPVLKMGQGQPHVMGRFVRQFTGCDPQADFQWEPS